MERMTDCFKFTNKMPYLLFFPVERISGTKRVLICTDECFVFVFVKKEKLESI